MAHNLYATVFEHPDYKGQYRWLTANVSDFVSVLNFNDVVSSIKIYKGKDYKQHDIIRFYGTANFKGAEGFIDLGPGFYPNIDAAPYNFGNRISSAEIRNGPPSHQPPHPALPQLAVQLIVRMFEHDNYKGQYRDVVATENSLALLGFNDMVSSIKIFPGPEYIPGTVCDFYEHDRLSGGILAPGRFGPGWEVPNLKPPKYFNDRISSVKIWKP